ncbi:MAG: deoxycytidylate deaminase [Bacteroidales bacterium]|nr:deoxycytidylate deaminase [Bacteroidales bacterium]
MRSNLAIQKLTESNSTENKGKTTKHKVDNTFTDELVVGICYPIGSKKSDVIETIQQRLKKYGYETKVIKLSKFIEKYTTIQKEALLGKTNSYSELIFKIKGGDEIRETYNSNSILADIAIWDINLDRMKFFQSDNDSLPDDINIKSRKVCYIIDSLKNKEELLLLRTVYRNIFYLISIFSPDKERKENLQTKNLSISEIDELIEKDEYENFDHGQNVRETFVEADFFLRVSIKNKVSLESRIERFFHLVFGSKIITPDSSERAMYAAKSAACNSACLSRQVGAAITDIKGDVIATGWNDAPKFGGNLYSDENQNDSRCCAKKECSNDKYKDDIIQDITKEILKDETLRALLSRTTEDTPKVVGVDNKVLLLNNAIKNTRVKGLIEFCRSIHAEMHAIVIGSQLSSNKMIGGKLYCTTYPCHNCARHIILAGIKEVFFIEPYKKSLGTKLHDDAITDDEEEIDKVRIIVFDGVAPRRYLEFFSMVTDERKKNGSLKSKELTSYFPKNRLSLQSLPTLEKQAILFLTEIGLIKEYEQQSKEN